MFLCIGRIFSIVDIFVVIWSLKVDILMCYENEDMRLFFVDVVG